MSSEGLPAEKIRAALGMESRGMPTILKQGLAKRQLSATGQQFSPDPYLISKRFSLCCA
jgi:hypothetical protein